VRSHALDTAPNAANAAAASKGAIRVTSDPPGAAIWINGDLRSEVTPATITQLPTGSAIDVKLTKDGFEQAKQSVTLSDATPNGTVEVALKRGSVTVDVVSKNDAKVVLSLDGKAYPGLSIDGVSSGDSHKLVVSASGYTDQTLTFAGAPFEKKHFDVTLERTSDVAARHAARAAAAAAQANAANAT
jgi:serine/threonine-protein kinase